MLFISVCFFISLITTNLETLKKNAKRISEEKRHHDRALGLFGGIVTSTKTMKENKPRVQFLLT